MSPKSTVQCQNCGTLFPGIHDVCPYCGEPQPLSDDAYYEDELPPDEEFVEDLEEEGEWIEGEEEAAPHTDELLTEDESPYSDDDIFAVVGEEEDVAYQEEDYAKEDYAEEAFESEDAYVDEDVASYEDAYEDEASYGDEEEAYYDEDDASSYDDDYDDDYDDEAYEDEIEERPKVWPRLLLGCASMLLCVLVFYGGIGIFATYRGLQERTTEIQLEAQDHYQRGLEQMDNENIVLAVAEFELALRLNPNLHAAREALREAEQIVQSQPTPTSETRLAAAALLLQEAEALITQENWGEAAAKLSQIKDLDPDFQPVHISDLIYQANYQWGLQLLSPADIDQAQAAFETALAEHPDDEQIIAQQAKAQLYIEGTTALKADNAQQAVKPLKQLYQQDSNYLDIKPQLLAAYIAYGDALAAEKEWCQAEAQYVEATLLQPDDKLKAKIDQFDDNCKEMVAAEKATNTPQPQTTTSASKKTPVASGNTTPQVTATDTPTETVTTGQGKIFYSAFNPNEARWEILSIPASGGTPDVHVVNGTMPALSPNGRLLVYHSELIESEGFHIYNMTSGEDNRITLYTRHILPHWGGDNKQFLFVAEEPGTGRWQVLQGFADGRSDPIIVRDGRTADLSANNSQIAYQGTDAEGNNPGIYLVPFGGGEETRLTNHESDRTPVFSPDGSQLAYMSTRNGNWDIYIVSTNGSAPRQISNAPGQDGLPIWSPDGSQIAYVSDADGSWAIYTVSANGGKPFKVIEWDGNRPDWLLAQIWWAR